ncbi:Hypothetical_protein [Hexamita inflata]|uniref:Hypothetical_protein n=1 Tax=Hexamita inflata TaxID=28002 RepID=A0AA86N7A5_9EUKA|nr:Hypothetical protein HINF_LOCUS1850 [Hexamita inflata]
MGQDRSEIEQQLAIYEQRVLLQFHKNNPHKELKQYLSQSQRNAIIIFNQQFIQENEPLEIMQSPLVESQHETDDIQENKKELTLSDFSVVKQIKQQSQLRIRDLPSLQAFQHIIQQRTVVFSDAEGNQIKKVVNKRPDQ